MLTSLVYYVFFNKLRTDYYASLTKLRITEHVTDLGLEYSASMSFRDYYIHIVKKANYLIHSMMCCFKGHNTAFYLFLYVTYVRPLLEFNSVIWSPTLIKDITLLESVQRNFTRRICLRDTPYCDRLKYLNLKSLEERRVIADLKKFFKLRNFDYADRYFVRCHSLRYSYNYQNVLSQSSLVKSFWFFRVVKFWNFLPMHVKMCNSYNSFCNVLMTVNFNDLLKSAART